MKKSDGVILPPIFIISLSDRSDRRGALMQALEIQGLRYQIWPAVDGRKGLAPEFDALIDRALARTIQGRDLSDAEFGCSLSHRQIYQYILDNEPNGAVILEDDAILSDDFQELLTDVSGTPHDLILFDYHRAKAFRYTRKAIRHRFLLKLANTPDLTTAYFISQSGARKMVDGQPKVHRLADWPKDLSKMDARIVFPRIVDHPDIETGSSDIRKSRNPLQRDAVVSGVGKTFKRYFTADYWKRKYVKFLSYRVPE